MKKIMNLAMYLLITVLLSSFVLGALDDAEHWVSGAYSDGTDESGNGRDFTVFGAVWNSTGCVLGSECWHFDGTNDILNNGDDAIYTPTGDFAHVLLVKPGTAGTTALGGVIATEEAVNNWNFYVEGDGATWFYRAFDGSTAFASIPFTSPVEWQLIVIQRNGTKMQLWRNNTLLENGAFNSNTLTGHGATYNYTIGRTVSQGVSYWDGILEYSGYYNHSLTTAEINSLWNSGSFYNPYEVIPSITYSSSIDLLFENSTGSFTNTMGEGEDFTTFINWTISPDRWILQEDCTDCSLMNATDGNYSTGIGYSGLAIQSINYTIPYGIANAMLQIKTNEEFTNYSISNECLYDNKVRLKLFNPDGLSHYSLTCFNSSGSEVGIWDSETANTFYEEAIHWNNVSLEGGVCNVTHVNSFVEFVALDASFTVCTSGCDYVSYSESFPIVSPINSVRDDIYFNACHEQTASGILYVNITCATGSYRKSVPASSIPLCTDGNATIRVNSTVCKDDPAVIIKVNGKNSPYSQRKRITNLHYDRQYSIHTDDATYNSSLGLWEIDEEHEYYAYGTRTVYANCSFPTNSTFDNSTSESLTIVNANPAIFFAQVNTTLGLTALSEGVVIQYASGVWNWLVSIIDTDAQHFNATWHNSSGQALHSIAGNPAMLELSTPDGLFTAVGTYSINVTVNDTFGAEANASINFAVNDTINPECNFPSEYRQENTTSLQFNVACTDENFYSLNVTCPANNYSFYADGLNVQYYLFNQTITNAVFDSCSFRYCDGHTASSLASDWQVIRNGSNAIDFVIDYTPKTRFYTADKNVLISHELKDDRVEFEVRWDDFTLLPYRTVFYQASENSHHFKSDSYPAWIVDSDSGTWFDLSGMPAKYEIIKHAKGLWEVRLYGIKQGVPVSFRSVGELNCVEGVFAINRLSLQERRPTQFTSIEQALFWFLLFIIWGFAVYVTLMIKGSHGETIQLVNMVQTVTGIIIGLGFMEFHFPVGLIIVLFSVGLGLGKMIEQ